jgi:hypothetical protein
MWTIGLCVLLFGAVLFGAMQPSELQPVTPVPILPVGPGASINAIVLFFTTLAGLISTWLTFRLSTQREQNAREVVAAQLAAAAADRAAERIAAAESAERQRRWDLEDRNRLAAKVEESKEVVAKAHKDLVEKIDVTQKAIEDNTKISADAFAAGAAALENANHFDVKLQAIRDSFLRDRVEQLRQHGENEARLKDIADTAATTLRVVERNQDTTLARVDEATQETLTIVKADADT